MRVPWMPTEQDQCETTDLTASEYRLNVRVPCMRTEQDQYETTDLTASGYRLKVRVYVRGLNKTNMKLPTSLQVGMYRIVGKYLP